MNRFVENILLLYIGIKDSLITWILLIGTILLLMLIFRCFTSPMKLAKKKLLMISQVTKEIIEEGKKNKEIQISPSTFKKLERNMISTQRLALAYYYDNSDDLNAKSILTLISRIHNSLEATRTERVSQDQKALSVLVKNMDKQSDEGLKLLREY